MRYFADSLEPATFDQLRAGREGGLTAWGTYVAADSGTGVTAWPQSALVDVELAGLDMVPIVAPHIGQGESTLILVRVGAAATVRAGFHGALAIDTERFEAGSPELKAIVDDFCTHVIELGWQPIIYRGAGYSGRGWIWEPHWSAPAGTIGPEPTPIDTEAVQYAGNVGHFGTTVDLSVAGVDFPFARRF